MVNKFKQFTGEKPRLSMAIIFAIFVFAVLGAVGMAKQQEAYEGSIQVLASGNRVLLGKFARSLELSSRHEAEAKTMFERLEHEEIILSAESQDSDDGSGFLSVTLTDGRELRVDTPPRRPTQVVP